MSETEVLTRPNGYEIVAFAHGEKPIYYSEFDYLDFAPEEFNAKLASENRCPLGGVWLLVGRGLAAFSIYSGEFGCHDPECPESDLFCRKLGSLQLVDVGDKGPHMKDRLFPPADLTREQATRFVREGNYRPFGVVPIDTMRQLCEERTLGQLLAAKFLPEWGRDPPVDRVPQDIMTALKLEMEWPLVLDDVLGVDNQELRARALSAFGRERLVKEAGAEVVQSDGENQLLRVQDMLFVHAKDASTSRRYLLRVPPRMQTVRQAIAWTFGFDNPDDYRPLKET